MGISWGTLFQDLDHICLEMQTGWGFEPPSLLENRA